MHIATTPTAVSRPHQIYRLSALAALVLSVTFLAGGIQLILSTLRPGSGGSWLPLLQNNWLLVLLQLNAGLNGLQFDLLSRLNVLDLTVLSLVALVHVGLYLALRPSSRAWSLVALAQPFLGILIFCITGEAGRSAVMGSMLVASALMLRGTRFGRASAFSGLAAAVLLLIGDLLTTPGSQSAWLSYSLAAGYVFFLLWLVLAARRLLQLASEEVS